MHIPVDVQIWRLSVFFLAGAASDILFQSYRAFRAVFQPKRFGYHLLDALVSLIFLSSLGALALVVNWGELRAYVPLTMLLGAFITDRLVGGVLYRRSRRVYAGTKRGFDWSRRNVVVPAKRATGRAAKWVRATLFPPLPPPKPPSPPESPDAPPELPPEHPSEHPPEHPPEQPPERPPADGPSHPNYPK